MNSATVSLSAACACGQVESATVGTADLRRYQGGELVQVAFPGLTPAEREVVIASRAGFFLCSTCWDAMGEG